MKKIVIYFVCAIVFTQTLSAYPVKTISGTERLMKGNERYATDSLEHPDRTSERREILTSTQKPFAIIVGCSDSRVAPEILFDQGVGDLFVMRVAGNVVGDIELESINYAVAHFDSSVIMVLGHENCGAVNAVMTGDTADIPVIASHIDPVIKKAATLESAVKGNVRLVANQLKKTKLISKMIKKNQIKVVGGYYDLNSGKVELIDP